MKRQIAVVAGLTLVLIAIVIMARNRTRPSALLQAGRTPVASATSPESEAAPGDEVDDPIVPASKKKKETKVSPAADDKKVAPAATPAIEVPETTNFTDVLVVDIGGGGFVIASEDLVAMASERLKLSDSQKVRVAAWADWKAKAIEGLSENQRGDAKKLGEIDNTYREGVKSELDQTQAEKLEKIFSRHR